MVVVQKAAPEVIVRGPHPPRIYQPDLESGWSTDPTYVVGSAATQIRGSAPCGAQTREKPVAAADPARTSSISPLLRGMRIGPYRLLRRVGQGAQGDVWKADRPGTKNAIVALKVLNPVLARMPERMAQFRHEAERGARIEGPALLRVLEFGEDRGCPYIAMPYISGTCLAEVIRHRKAHLRGEDALPAHAMIEAEESVYQRWALKVMAATARGLGRIHAQRIVHRDVKPANILLESHAGHGVYLCDLGLGRDLDVATPDQMRDGAGTPMYMAPERLLRAHADETLCDIYSLGVTLFETVTLERPHHVTRQVPAPFIGRYLLSHSPRLPRQVKAEIHADTEAVILKAMSHNPGNRQSSAAEFASELDALIRKLPEPLPAPHFPDPVRQLALV